MTPTFDVQTINFNLVRRQHNFWSDSTAAAALPAQCSRGGQLVSVAVEQGSVTLDIRYPDGRVENASNF